MNIYANEMGHMTNMAAMPIYGKNLKKSSPPEPIDRLPWNLVFSIVYAFATYSKYDPGLTLTYFTPRSNFVTGFLYGKKWK